jgi:hypothetical protein
VFIHLGGSFDCVFTQMEQLKFLCYLERCEMEIENFLYEIMHPSNIHMMHVVAIGANMCWHNVTTPLQGIFSNL